MDEDRWERKRQRWERRWERRQRRWRSPRKHLVSGIVFIGIGFVFLLGNLGMIQVEEVFRFWPLLLILFGVIRLVERPDGYRESAGIFWIVIGLVFLAGSLGFLRVAVHDLWPVALIGVGALMLWRSSMARRQYGDGPGDFGERLGRKLDDLGERLGRAGDRFGEKLGGDSKASAGPDAGANPKTDTKPANENTASSNSVLSAMAILGGVERQNNCQDFRGGDVTAILGGCEIDLRGASITPPHEPVLEVFALWGGIEVRVPDDWTVISQVDPILGGFEDKTDQPKNESKRFVIRGSVVMGGIEVKN